LAGIAHFNSSAFGIRAAGSIPVPVYYGTVLYRFDDEALGTLAAVDVKWAVISPVGYILLE